MGNNNSNPKNIKRRPHIKKEVNKQGNSNKKIKQDVQRNLKKKKNRTNTNKKGSPARKPNGKPNGKPNVKPTRKPNGKPSDKPNGNKANGSRQPGFPGFDPNQIIADLSGTLSNFTYISKTNTMSIFWASDVFLRKRGFKLVYNIIEG